MLKDVSREQFDEMFRIIHLNACDNGLSVIAFDSSTNGLVGGFTAENPAEEPAEAKKFFHDNYMKMLTA